jgi:hypothetical protein
MRINAIYLFVATCVCWSLPDLDRLDEMVTWLVGPDLGLHDVIKDWHADCKQRKGRRLAFGCGDSGSFF